MTYLKWEDKLSVGVAEVDEEHKRMVDIVVALHNSVIAGMSDECFIGLFDSLVDCTVMHFRHEEKLMERAQYPDFATHREEHEKLLMRLRAFREDVIDRSDSQRSIDMMNYLRIWLLDHIREADMKLGAFLCAATVRAAG